MDVEALAELDVGDVTVGQSINARPFQVEPGLLELRLGLRDQRMFFTDPRRQCLFGSADLRPASLSGCLGRFVFLHGVLVPPLGGGLPLEDHDLLVVDHLRVTLLGGQALSVLSANAVQIVNRSREDHRGSRVEDVRC